MQTGQQEVKLGRDQQEVRHKNNTITQYDHTEGVESGSRRRCDTDRWRERRCSDLASAAPLLNYLLSVVVVFQQLILEPCTTHLLLDELRCLLSVPCVRTDQVEQLLWAPAVKI